MQEETPKKKVLVLGGSTFMGKTLLQMLSKEANTFEIHYINRGKKYWDNEVQSIPHLNYFYGNRDESLDFTRVLIMLTHNMSRCCNTFRRSTR